MIVVYVGMYSLRLLFDRHGSEESILAKHFFGRTDNKDVTRAKSLVLSRWKKLLIEGWICLNTDGIVPTILGISFVGCRK